MTSQTATASGGATGGLMNLSYGYQASAGQSGAGTTVGNSGQLMSVSGTIGGLTESASYSYDLQGRLTTSSQTTNGASAQRRFAYDRFGNRTGVWDAVSGGTQIQAVTLHQSGGAATNRLTSVTDSGVTKNYTYDAAGNLINDGVHSYEYDAENRLKAVDWGSANGVAYAYDYANRRIKKLAAGVSTNYVWEGSQVIAEHDGTSGAVIFNYVYASGKLIARMGSGIIKWYVSDRLSSRIVLDDAGAIVGRQGHLPYGEEIGGSGEQEKHKFTTYERDGESGTDYAVNRQYAQGVGRFMRVDPVEGTIANPQSLNRYAYVQNEPVNRVDPLGLFFRGDMPFECILYPILCEPWWIPEYDTRPTSRPRALFAWPRHKTGLK